MEKKWFEFKNSTGSTEILIYEQVGKDWFSGEGVGAKDFAAALKDVPEGNAITVAINSPGGNVFDGLAIYNQLKALGSRVTVRIDGVAASIASIIAMAGNTIVMPENAMLMIHNPWSAMAGDAEEFRKAADSLDKVKESLVSVYRDRTGLDDNKIAAMMDDETWLTGADALALGFVDRVEEPVRMVASLDFSRFQRVPKALKEMNTKPNAPVNQGKSPTIMEETKNMAPVDQGKPATPTVDNKVNEELKALKASLENERKARIGRDVDALIASGQVPSAQRDQWLNRAIADESIVDALRSLPVPGAAPVPPSGVVNLGNSLIEEYDKMEAGADRKSFLIRNHADILRAKTSFNPQNANTIAAALTVDHLSDALVTVVGTKLAMVNAFTRDFGLGPIPRSSVQVRKATAASTVQTNPTNFESGDSTLAAIEVDVNQKSKSFHITNNEFQSGSRLAHLAEINAQDFALDISKLITAVMTVGNFGAGTVIGAAANFDSADLPPIMALAKNYPRKNLILDGGHLAYLLPADKTNFRLGEQGAYGFDLIAEQNDWTGAIANTAGFICSPNAIAIANGVPLDAPAGQFVSIKTVEIPMLGLTSKVHVWYSVPSRTWWASYDTMIGVAAGDTTAAEVLITA